MATASPEKGQALQPSRSRRPEPTLSIAHYREIASLAEAAELRYAWLVAAPVEPESGRSQRALPRPRAPR